MSSPLRAWRESRTEVLSLEVLASSTAQDQVPCGQFRTLVRHFLIRFFAGEIATEDRDTKTRVVQAACAIAVPPLVVALYLYPVYHLPHHALRPYWDKAGDHLFFVLYSFVSMALVTIFEWDLLYPDLLDVFVLSPLPVRLLRLLAARVVAVVLLFAGALLDSNFLAPLVLPAATEPPGLFRFLTAHLLAVTMSGLCGAALLLALEGVLLALLGDRIFRRISLWIQGAAVVVLLTMLFLYPVFAGSLRGILESGSRFVQWTPPFWFLGVDQRLLDGPSTPLLFRQLAHVAVAGTLLACVIAILSYPLAWWRRTRDLVEGRAARVRRRGAAGFFSGFLHATVVRSPSGRAIWHFIGQNLVRVPRYRMVLVMAGGMGAALVAATVARVQVLHGRLEFMFSRVGLQAVIPIIVFWTVAGLRSTFLAPADRRGRWVFRVTTGKGGVAEFRTAENWVLTWTLLLSGTAAWWAHDAAPPVSHPWMQLLTQLLVAVSLSLLLTDAFFLNVCTIPFTGTRSTSATNFALLLIPYLGFFPAVVLCTMGAEPWISAAPAHLLFAAAVALVAHLCLIRIRRAKLEDYLQQIEPDEDEEPFPLRLGLRS